MYNQSAAPVKLLVSANSWNNIAITTYQHEAKLDVRLNGTDYSFELDGAFGDLSSTSKKYGWAFSRMYLPYHGYEMGLLNYESTLYAGKPGAATDATVADVTITEAAGVQVSEASGEIRIPTGMTEEELLAAYPDAAPVYVKTFNRTALEAATVALHGTFNRVDGTPQTVSGSLANRYINYCLASSESPYNTFASKAVDYKSTDGEGDHHCDNPEDAYYQFVKNASGAYDESDGAAGTGLVFDVYTILDSDEYAAENGGVRGASYELVGLAFADGSSDMPEVYTIVSGDQYQVLNLTGDTEEGVATLTFKAVGSPAVGKFIVASYDKFGNMVEFHDVAFPAYTGENQTITFNKTNLTNQGVVRKAFYVDSMLTLNSTFVAVEF